MSIFRGRVNSLPNDKFLYWSKLKALAEDKINATKRQMLFLRWVENIVGKGENAGCQDFRLFSQFFQKLSFSGLLIVGIMWQVG